MNLKEVNKLLLTACLAIMLTITSYAQDTPYYLETGIEAYQQQDYPLAIESFERVINDSHIIDLSPQLNFWYAKALFQNSRMNYFKSIEQLDIAISKDPKYSEAYFIRARLRYFVNGINHYVIEDYKKAYSNAKNNDLKDIFIKGISLANIKTSEAEIRYLNENIAFAKLNHHNKLGELCYTLAVIYSQENNIDQSLFWLNSAISFNYKPSDLMFIDFYNIRQSKKFLDIMRENDIPPVLYQTESIDALLTSISSGEFGLERSITIKKYVENKINTWQKKGKFEKTIDYQQRVSEESRTKKIQYYTQKAIDSIGYSMVKWGKVSNEYDADNESFKITFVGFDPLYVGVPLLDAPSFDANFDSLEFQQFKFVLLDDYTTEISHIEITNLAIGKTYIYNSTDNVLFNSTEFAFNFDELEVPIEGVAKIPPRNNLSQKTKIISVGKSDVDTNIPKTDLNNRNTYALIIGNEDYTKYQTSLSSESNVDFAIRDAEIFAEYAEMTLGIPSENITVLKDAISSQMQREIEKISKIAKYHNGEANIIFYYAGHGFPDETTKESYLMPVDISGADVTYGIKLNYLYQQLTQYPSQKVLVILDACFSGGGRNQGLLAARGVSIKPKENVINGNLVVFSSSTGMQSSLPYQNKRHGMFTYFLLKKLKETKGEITLEELSDYVTKEVQINALKINSKEQNPNVLVSPNVDHLWMDWKLN